MNNNELVHLLAGLSTSSEHTPSDGADDAVDALDRIIGFARAALAAIPCITIVNWRPHGADESNVSLYLHTAAEPDAALRSIR